MEFSVGNVLSRTLAVIRERIWSLLGLWAIFFGISMVGSMIFGIVFAFVGTAAFASMASMGDSDGLGGLAGLGAGMIVTMIVFYAGFIYLFTAQACSFASMGAPYERPLFGDALKKGFGAGLTMLAVTIVLLLLFGVFALVLGIGIGIGIVGLPLFGIVPLLLLPVWIYLGCRLSIVVPIATNEASRNPITVIKRSWQLTKGHVLQILLIVIVFTIIAMVLLGVLFLPFVAMIENVSTAAAIGSAIFGFIGFVVAAIIISVGQGVMTAVIHGMLTSTSDEQLGEVFG